VRPTAPEARIGGPDCRCVFLLAYGAILVAVAGHGGWHRR